MLTIKPTPPYDFARMLAVEERFHPVMDIVRNGEYWRALHVGDQIALARVCSQGTVDKPLLDVHLVAATGDVDHQMLHNQLSHILSADEDLNPFYAFAASDHALWETVAPLRGLRLMRAASVFEGLMVTIIEQQITLKNAQRAERWLVEWANNSILHLGETYYAFPTPQQIAAAQVADLIPLKITFRRMQVLDTGRQPGR
jgi:DNA-3-methyladenine glycosylase II